MDDALGIPTSESSEEPAATRRRDPVVHRATPASRRRALAHLLTGVPHEDAGVVDAFLDFAKTHGYGIDHLWMAEADDGVVASALIMPNPGRTALLFVSPAHAESDRVAIRAAVRHACEAVDRREVRLVQALLNPSQVLERKALLEVGFTRLATLQYMQTDNFRRCASKFASHDDIQILTWSLRTRDRFVAATLGSYEETLDCPGLVGLRRIDDILDGHMATGHFVPDLWFTLAQGEEPVGVMLLNPIPDQQAIELVYLGLCPRWRGCGIGNRLLRHGFAMAAQHGANKMLLAVDQDNTPALHLYRSSGFAATARKYAMLFALP